MLLPSLLQALCPPTFVDALMYHLNAPRHFLSAGRIARETTIPLGHYPFALQMLFGLGLALASERVGALVHLGFLAATLAAVAVLCRRLVPGPAWVVAVLLVAGIPHVQRLAGQPAIDLGLAFAVTASLLSLLRYLRERRTPDLALAGLAAGLGCGVKQQGLIGALALAVALGLELAARRAALRRPLAVFGACTLLAAAPWYAKSAIWTLNPLYPVGNRLLHGIYAGLGVPEPARDVLRREWFSDMPELAHVDLGGYHRLLGRGHDLADLVMLPVWMSIDSRDTPADEPPVHYKGESSPLYLVLLPLLLLVRPVRAATVAPCLVVAGVMGGALALVAPQHSYFFPVLAVLAIPAAAVATSGGTTGRILLAACVTCWTWGAATTWVLSYRRGDPAAAVGFLAPDAYLTHNLVGHAAFVYANQSLPAGSRILLTFDPEVLRLQVPHVGADPLHLVALEAFVGCSSSDEFIARMDRSRITHVHLPRRAFAILAEVRDDAPYQKMLQDLFIRDLARIYADGRSYLFAVPRPGAGPARRRSSVPASRGIMHDREAVTGRSASPGAGSRR
jgi:4-amino-4-deoxy-L-arabinose transferase-like glycosyltransferase